MNERYSKQIILDKIGTKGQQKIAESKVAIVGIGALGTVAAELLARSGVGELLLIDRDVVEKSNLQRQMLFSEKDIGQSKATSASKKLKEINSEIIIKEEAIHLNPENINLIQDYNLVLDCTDNLKTRFLLNDYCKQNNLKWIYSSAIKTKGYVMPIFPEGPCLRCFLQEANLESCDTSGVINTITTSIASFQATLALKILMEISIEPHLFFFDIWNYDFKKIKVNKNKNCPTCNGIFNFEKQEKIVRFCSTGKFQIIKKINFEEIWNKLVKLGATENNTTLKFKNLQLFKDGRVLIKADSEKEAMIIYSKWIGD
jgi:molybdopterin-synthase adenylyltransferase